MDSVNALLQINDVILFLDKCVVEMVSAVVTRVSCLAMAQ